MANERHFRLTDEHFSVQYHGVSVPGVLTNGDWYFAIRNPKGNLMVLNEKRRWNKYAEGRFTIANKIIRINKKPHHYERLSRMGTRNYEIVTEEADIKTNPNITLSGKTIAVMPSATTSTAPVTSSTTTVNAEMPTTTSEVKEKKPMSTKPRTLTEFLISQGLDDVTIRKIQEFRKEHKLEDLDDPTVYDRVEKPDTWYVGKIWKKAVLAILTGKHLVLAGDKATGKNVLSNSLAYLFGRPLWDISCHVNTNAESLIGGETFRGGQVEFKPGSIYNVAKYGGFGVLDEVNMAKPDALAVLHSVTDGRRVVDVPGYERLKLHPATRFIGTMNSGYAGTKELNEAFGSRFCFILVDSMTEDALTEHLRAQFPTASPSMIPYFSKLFCGLQTKAKNAEISSRAVDLRGIKDGLDLIEAGLSPYEAMEMGIIDKLFDSFERDIVTDLVKALIPPTWKAEQIFPNNGSISVSFDTL